MINYLIDFSKRIVTTFFLILLTLAFFEIISKLLDKNMKYDNYWIIEDKIINKMNKQKIQNSSKPNNGLWLHQNEELLPKKEGVKRILIVGDSFIFGNGYSNSNHIWWQQLKHLLKEEGYTDVEIVAAGVDGYSTEEELEYILKDSSMISLVDPDFIIMDYVNNDPEDEYYRNLPIAYSDFLNDSDNLLVKAFTKLYPVFSKKVSELLFNKLKNNEKFEKKFGISYYSWTDLITSGQNLIRYENEVIKNLNEYINNEIKCPYIYYITGNDSKELGIDRIMDLFNRNNIKNYFWPVYSMKYNQKCYVENYKINPVNSHPSVELCQEYARCLVEILKEDYPEILGKKSDVEYVPKFNINDWMPYSILPEKINENTYIITYPKEGEELSFLYMPIKKNYIKLNLEDPINIDKISIEGKNIDDVTLWINSINEDLGFDDQVMTKIKKEKDSNTWKVDSDKKITSINLNIKFKYETNREIIIKVE